jgi:hypothetical protein
MSASQAERRGFESHRPLHTTSLDEPMVLPAAQLVSQLNAKKNDFLQYDSELSQVWRAYQQALNHAQALSPAQLLTTIPQEIEWSGARPLEPWPQEWRIPLGMSWPHRDAARSWAKEQLQGVTTIAVDGSQILPTEEISTPVGVVQAGWFINPHCPDQPYSKDIHLELITPAELWQARQHYNQDQPHRFSERFIHLKRFQLELATLRQLIATRSLPRQTLALFDGSLVLTFAESYDHQWQQQYVQGICDTLQQSEQQQVPLVAYIDYSQARDLVTLLCHTHHLRRTNQIFDCHLLNDVLSQWGDRSPFFVCDRGDEDGSAAILGTYGTWSHQIGFCYLKAHQGYPVRLELPVWIYTAGLLNSVIRWLCGELISGQGYPYALEAADQVAVLQRSDRQAFLKQLQQWAEQVGVELRFSRKWVSKQSRR